MASTQPSSFKSSFLKDPGFEPCSYPRSLGSTEEIYGRDLDLESSFCRDFSCCGLLLEDLHVLVQHHEQCHGRPECDGQEAQEDKSAASPVTPSMGVFEVEWPMFESEDRPCASPSTPSSLSDTSPPSSSCATSQACSPKHLLGSLMEVYFEAEDADVRAGSPLDADVFRNSPTAGGNRLCQRGMAKDDSDRPLSQAARRKRSFFVEEESSRLNPVRQNGSGACMLLGQEQLLTTLPTSYVMAAEELLMQTLEGMKDLAAVDPEMGSISQPAITLATPAPPRPVIKPYKCPVEGCTKSYKNPNGLKYHSLHGHGIVRTAPPSSNPGQPDQKPYSTAPESSANGAAEFKPYKCPLDECSKTYKNVNGLKYHLEHHHHRNYREVLGPSSSCKKFRHTQSPELLDPEKGIIAVDAFVDVENDF